MRAGFQRGRGFWLLGAWLAACVVLLGVGLALDLPSRHGLLFAAVLAAFIASDRLCSTVVKARRAAFSGAVERR